MTCFVGAIIVVGVALGGVLAYVKIASLERSIRDEEEETRAGGTGRREADPAAGSSDA